eukprot:g22215.t1
MVLRAKGLLGLLLAWSLLVGQAKLWDKIELESAPSGRFLHSMVLHARRIWIFGGAKNSEGPGDEPFNDLQCFDMASEKWIQVAPAQRLGSDPSPSDAIDLSAKTGHYGSWTPVQTAGTPPAARTMHSAVTDGFGGMWIFGGLRVGPSTSPSEAIFNDVQYFDFEGKNWTQIECAGDLPTKRFGHSAVLTSLTLRGGKHMWIFGGQGEPDNFEALAYLNLVTQSWFRVTSKGTAPPSLLAHASVLDAAGRMWVLGGQASPDQANGKVYYLDTLLNLLTELRGRVL